MSILVDIFRVMEMAVKKEKGELISIEGFSLIRFFFQALHFNSMFTSKTQTPASSFGYPIHHYTWQQYY